MEIPEILDVTTIEPSLKHNIIFERFDTLKPGAFFVMHNNNDPEPIYHQLLAEHGENFTWKPLEKGPDMWRVKIKKKIVAYKEETIGDIVARDYGNALIFKQFGIDFTCGGKRTVNEACEQKGIQAEQVNKLLASAIQSARHPEMDYQNWEIGLLCKYVINLHHQYIKTNGPFMLELAQKLIKTYGEKHPEIIAVAGIFEKAGKLLTLNIAKEEEELFPYITLLNTAHKNGTIIKAAAFGPVSSAVYLVEADHQKVAIYFEQLRALTHNYQVPPYVLHGFEILYKMLQDYEADLHLHLHLENNILFPKAIQMENEMRIKKQIQ
jgi:regulator of cell morphogenesis and NO signaling